MRNEEPIWIVLFRTLYDEDWRVFAAGEDEDKIKGQFDIALEQKEDGAIGEVRLIEPEYIYRDSENL